jgi:hypothetical protein
VYWAEQDLIIADEYRDGNVPAGMDNLPLIRRSFLSLPAAITKLYFRADSACYERNVLRWLADEHRHGGPHGHIGFTISADMTPELRQVCCEVPDDDWQLVDEPEWTESSSLDGVNGGPRGPAQPAAVNVPMKPCVVPTSNSLQATGPKTPNRFDTSPCGSRNAKVFYSHPDTNRSSLPSCPTARTSRPSNCSDGIGRRPAPLSTPTRVTKNELGAAPPSKYFGANAAWYRLSMLTYNVLSAMNRSGRKSITLPPTLSAARPKKLRFALFTTLRSVDLR